MVVESRPTPRTREDIVKVVNVFRPKPTYSSVVATIALFLALGGSVYAATQLPKNSVGRKQLRKNSVASSKVKDGSLLSSDFKAGQLPRGPQGPPGATGAQGLPGARGPGAVKLYFDAGNDNQLVTMGTVGPWTLRAQCINGGASVPAPFAIFAEGPGSADVASTSQFNSEPPEAGFTHVELSEEERIFSIGVKSPSHYRVAGTMILSAEPTDPVVTVPFTILSDAGARRCTFAGNAVPAG
jgi:hypothetical protein